MRSEPRSPAFFRGMESAAKHAPEDELASAAIDGGREALAAAAAAAARAAAIHAKELDRHMRAERLREALAEGAKQAETVAALANLSAAAEPALRFAKAAREALARLPQPGSRKRGSPGRPVYKAAALAAATAWGDFNGRTVPTGGVKGKHPIADLLAAISTDLWDHPGFLSPELLRPGRKSRKPA